LSQGIFLLTCLYPQSHKEFQYRLNNNICDKFKKTNDKHKLNFSKYGADFDIFKVKLDKVINEIHFKNVNFISDF
jgi:hypothetical protein